MENLLDRLAKKSYVLDGNLVVGWNVLENIVKEYMGKLENDVVTLAVDNKLNDVLVEMKKLEIKNGDFLLVETDTMNMDNNFYQQFGERLRYMLDKNGFKDVTVILVNEKIKVELINEKMMYKAGWLRKEKVAEFVSNVNDAGNGMLKIWDDGKLVIKVGENGVVEINGMKYTVDLFDAWAEGGLKLYTTFMLIKREDGIITLKKINNNGKDIITN